MDLSQITTLFGRSIYDPLIDQAMAECGAHCADKVAFSRQRYASILSTTMGLTFTFWYKGFYKESIAEPQSTFKPDTDEEVVLSEMTFRPEGLSQISLPYGLRFGDSSAAIEQTVGQRPFSKSKNVAGEPIWTFYDDDFELLVVFDETMSLGWFRIWALHKAERNKRDLVESIKSLGKHISPENAEAIEKRRDAMPTKKWARRMSSGDKAFTAEILADSEEIFTSFIAAVTKATKKKNPTAIYSAVKKAVTGFNKLCKKRGSFVETMEREEIVDFLQGTVQMSGIPIEKGVDLTQDYRTW